MIQMKTGSQRNTTRGLSDIESSELEHGKCSNSKNNRVLLTQIKETNMFLRSDQLTSVALITQNNSLTLIFFNQVKEHARYMKLH